MKSTYLAIFFCALWTLASSLPLMPITSDVLARETNYQWFSKRAIPHSISLKKSSVGTDNEHWALHVHPQVAGKSDLHVLHAVSDPGSHGVLQVEHINKGTFTGPSSNPTSQTVHLGDFASRTAAHSAIHDAESNVALTHQFPAENCVDFCRHAVQHMVTNGHLPQSAADTMDHQWNTHEATVRTNTNTPANQKAAGL